MLPPRFDPIGFTGGISANRLQYFLSQPYGRQFWFEDRPTDEFKSGLNMKKIFALLFAGLLFASVPGCAKPVDKADEPVDGLTVEGVPPLDGDEPTDKGEVK